MATGTVVGTGDMTVTPVTGSLPTIFTPTPTPEPTIAPGTIGEDSCLQCTLRSIFCSFVWQLTRRPLGRLFCPAWYATCCVVSVRARPDPLLISRAPRFSSAFVCRRYLSWNRDRVQPEGCGVPYLESGGEISVPDLQ